MALIRPPEAWRDLSFYYNCSNWTTDNDGTEVRMTNRASALRAMSNSVNHIFARQARPIFTIAQPAANMALGGAYDPLFRWLFYDDWDNAKTYTVHIVMVPTDTITSAAHVQQWSGSQFYSGAGVGTPFVTSKQDAVALFRDAVYHQFTVTRGTVTDALADDGISSYDGYNVLAVSVYEDILPFLDTSTHTFCDVGLAKKGREITSEPANDVRSKFHEARTTGMPYVFSWAAVGTTATPSAPGGKTGLHLNQTSWVNLFDHSITSRTTSSPGQCCDFRYSGRGAVDETPGKQVAVEFEVLANATTNDAEIKFIGSDNISSNESPAITVTGGGGLDWYTRSGAYCYLTTTHDPSTISTAMNKIDVHGRIPSGGSCYIYGLRGRIVYT